LNNINSNFSHFLENIETLGSDSYQPTTMDILYCRNKTTGVSELQFQHDSKNFLILDVGGQRSERRKWIHSFDAVHFILFFVSLSDYDQKLEEDIKVNRMSESLKLFGEIANSRWFSETPIALMLNKRDLFEEKLTVGSLRAVFPEYNGDHSFDSAIEYITAKFIELNASENRKIYPHTTCATDSVSIKNVFQLILENEILKRSEPIV